MLSWLVSLAVACLVAVLSGAASLVLALRAVEWYRVSSFEGKSGYAVVGGTLLGAAAGWIGALVVARVAVGFAAAGFLGQLAAAILVCGLLWVVTACGLWRRADIPPRWDGQPLRLVLEIEVPADQFTAPSATDPTAAIELGVTATWKNVLRKRAAGYLNVAAARNEEGRWLIPGEIELFTARGRPLLLVTLGGVSEGFVLPWRGRPSRALANWSPWLPHPRPDGLPPVNRRRYRFRIEPLPETV